MWLGISERGLFRPLTYLFIFWSLKNLMGAHWATDCKERALCGGRGLRRLLGKAGRGPPPPPSSREGGGLPGVWAFSPQSSSSRGAWEAQPDGMWDPFKSTPKAWLLSSFTRACLGGSGHWELGGMLHSNKHSKDFNPLHVLLRFAKFFSLTILHFCLHNSPARQAGQTSSPYIPMGWLRPREAKWAGPGHTAS